MGPCLEFRCLRVCVRVCVQLHRCGLGGGWLAGDTTPRSRTAIGASTLRKLKQCSLQREKAHCSLPPQFTQPRVEKIMGMITAGHSTERRQRNGKDSVLFYFLFLLHLSPLWPLAGGFSRRRDSCYGVALGSDELLALFLRFFLTR